MRFLRFIKEINIRDNFPWKYYKNQDRVSLHMYMENRNTQNRSRQLKIKQDIDDRHQRHQLLCTSEETGKMFSQPHKAYHGRWHAPLWL